MLRCMLRLPWSLATPRLPEPHPLPSRFQTPQAAADTEPPVLRLLGGAVLRVQQGQLLEQAPGFGATAVDAVDGTVTAVAVTGLAAANTSQARGCAVPACCLSPRFLLSPVSCTGLPLPQVGSYTITYTAADRAGNTASSSQTVAVVSPCEPPERLCLSTCTCSTFG